MYSLKQKIKSEHVFDKAEYFEQALIGVYIKMASRSLYGQELTFYFVDALADIYDFNDVTTSYAYAANKDYLYSGNIYLIEDIWLNAYNALANINIILENLETQSVLDEVTADLIEGEARGLRAFIHFDLLRMFGPGDLANNSAVFEEKVIPYITKYERFLSPQLTVSEVLAQIHSDLDKSIELLNKGDIWGNEFPDDYSGNNFVKNEREYRFNYWAAIATKARACLWEGDHENALLYSEKFINESEIEFVAEDDVIYSNLGFTREFVFALHVHDLYNQSSIYRYFEEEMTSAANASFVMYIQQDRYNAIFEIEGGGGESDLRLHLFNNYDVNKSLYKYHQENTNPSPFNNKVALIRKPEMYYIAAESLNKLGIRDNDAIELHEPGKELKTLTGPFNSSRRFTY